MATAVGDSYSGASGATIYGGRFPTSAAVTSRQQLFLDVASATPTFSPGVNDWYTLARASIAAPKDDYLWGAYGPSDNFVEQYSQWAWVNTGGDWIDTASTSQGTLPHFSFAANNVASGNASYTASITAGCQAAQTGSRYNAYIVKIGGSGTRAIATKHHATLAAPSILVTYTDLTVATLACLACVPMHNGTTYTQMGSSEADFTFGPTVALEFERPIKAVTSATLTIQVTQHTATSATIQGFLANPTINSGASVVTGLAANYVNDSGIGGSSSVLFAHQYIDGTALTDWVIPFLGNYFDVNNWSPDLYGLGAADNTKFPTALGGVPLANKWFEKAPTGNVSLVSSSYNSEGFAPLVAGVGAIRTIVPKATDADGASFPSQAGSTGADLLALFAKAQSGNLDRIFVRFYVRIGTNASSPATLANTKMFRVNGASSASYAHPHGKFGIGSHFLTKWGGNNNVGGTLANPGWSDRKVYWQLPADATNAGMFAGTHSEDMLGVNQLWGQTGDLGASFYPGRWYCVEQDLTLNTYVNGGGSPSDAVAKTYIDGKLVSTYTGFKYRDGPSNNYTSTPLATGIAGYRTLGPIGLWLNDYNGGTLPSDQDQVFFYTGVVAATSYIGPLGSAPSTVPAWIQAMTLNTWAVIPASNKLSDLNPDNDPLVNPNYPGTAPWRIGGNFTSQCGSWTGAVPRTDTNELYWCNNGGHNDGYDAATYKLVLNAPTPFYARVNKPSGAVGLTAMNYSTEFARGTKQIDANGRHRTQHTESFQFYWPSQGIATLSGILLSNSGGNEFGFSQPYISSAATGEMTYFGANNNNNAGGGYDSACYDSIRNVGWKMPSSSSASFSKWGGPSADSWTTVGPGNFFSGPVSLCHIPTLDLILVGNGGDDQGSGLQTVTGGFGVFDPASGSLYANGLTGTFPTFSGSPALNNPWASGLYPGLALPQWESSLGACLAWHNKSGHETQIMRITPPVAGDPRTGAWTVDYLPVAGSNTVTPSVSQLTGTYGRFAVFPSLGICVVVNNVSEAGYAFKYRAL